MDKALNFTKKFANLLSNRLLIILICFSTGILSTLPYYFEKLFVLTFVSLFVLFYVVISQRRVNKGVFLPFFFYFLGYYLFLYLFLSELYPYDYFGFTKNQAVFVMVCSCIMIPLLHTVVETIIFSLSKFIPTDNILFPIGMGAIWVLGEAILSVGTLAFPWANISISLTGWLPYLQTASLFGNGFISLITVFLCCSIALSVYDKRIFFAYVGLSVLLCNILSGYLLWFLPVDNTTDIKSAAVQGNVLFNEKWNSANQNKIFERYLSMTEDAAKSGAELIVLPEGAIPAVFKENKWIHKSFAEIATKYNVTIIMGVHVLEDNIQRNSVVAILPDGSLSERYDKLHLVPFAETIPFSETINKFIPFVAEFSADTGEYTKGDDYKVFEASCGNIAPLICFDSIFPNQSSNSVKNGATLLTVVTNDSWFNDSAGIYTHLRHSQLRAIENRRYVIRGANTGISAFINQRGEIIEKTNALEEDIIYSNISNIQALSLYSLIGNWITYASIFIMIFIIIYHIRRNKNGKNTIASIRNI